MVVRNRLTLAEFEAIADELGTCEFERGKVVYLSPAGYFHNRATMNLAFALEAWARRTRRGRVVSNETGIVTQKKAPATVRGADILYISYARLPRGEAPQGFLRVAPELVVEVVGPRQGWQRVLTKVGEYFEIGVDRVWLVDPKKRQVHVYRPDSGPEVLEGRATLKDDALLPRFSCKLTDIFEVAGK